MAKLNSFWSLLLLLVACVSFVFAQEQEENASANLEVTADFPDNPFGHITNGQRNKVMLKLANKDKADFSVLAVSGKLSLVDQPDKIVRNLTALRYDLTVPADGNVEIPYLFHSEFAPGEHALTVYIDVFGDEKLLRVVGYEGIITIVDPETSWLDPQLIFLYIVLSAVAVGVGYIINAAFFGGAKPAKAKKVSSEPASKPAHRDEKGQMILDESWIPEQQLGKSPKQSPRVKKRSSGRK